MASSRRGRRRAAGLSACFAAIAGPVSAQVPDPVDQAVAPSTLASVQPDAGSLSAICTDRPTKSNYACTVDAGHFQYETDLVNATFQRSNGVTTDTLLFTNPTLKYGLAEDLDVEANIAPVEVVRTHDTVGGTDRTLAGPGDLYLRVKYEVLSSDDEVLQAAILPYVKAPTARPLIGNGVVEGGAILPVNYEVVKGLLTLTIAPEVDAYKDSHGAGRHLNTAELINAALALPFGFTVFGELWGDWNFDPAGTIRQRSADFAVTYDVGKYLQLDTGVNVGINRATPGVQAYVGLSQKF